MISIYLFVDDTQLYIWHNTDNAAFTVRNLEMCLESIKQWTSEHFLQLNESKTQLIQISSPRSRPTHIESLNFNGSSIKSTNYVENLGFDIDDTLSMKKQINVLCSSGYFILKNFWNIASKLSSVKLKTQLVHACILSKPGVYILQKSASHMTGILGGSRDV